MRTEFPEGYRCTKVMVAVAGQFQKAPARPSRLGVPCMFCLEFLIRIVPSEAPVPDVVNIF